MGTIFWFGKMGIKLLPLLILLGFVDVGCEPELDEEGEPVEGGCGGMLSDIMNIGCFF